jgi:hypothetical protein
VSEIVRKEGECVELKSTAFLNFSVVISASSTASFFYSEISYA